LLPWLRLLVFVPILVAARIRGIERRTLARLRDAGADTAERAILLAPGGAMTRLVHRRLEKNGALRKSGSDRYYLCAAAYEAARRRRRRVGLTVLSVYFIVIAILFFSGVFS